VAAARDGGCTRVLAVVSADATEVHRLAGELGVPITPNPTPEEGMFSSVRLGVERALGEKPPSHAMLLFPVDHPLVRPDTVARLLEILGGAPPRAWVQPRWEDRGGHPIALDREGARALLAIPAGHTLRRALDEADLTLVPVPVPDPAVLRNLNTPQDLV